ncbi:MAG: FAD-dependent oxidoreductase [bacterium]|nr:FAD-dependent oxidoreductase [bacterium]
MKIAVLGGGFTGLTASYLLSKKGHAVTLLEKETFLGGLAAGFKQPNWDWYLERAYHHLFANDNDIMDFAKETGFDHFLRLSPSTDSLYEVKHNYRIFPVDSPQDFLRLPLLPLLDKMRAGVVVAGLKFSPFLPLFEKYTAKDFLEKTMGKKVWEVFWKEMFRKKFGTYAENILASFIWARITKRTKDLMYIEGGFQTLIDHLEKVNKAQGVDVRMGEGVVSVTKKNNNFMVKGMKKDGESIEEEFDVVISTLPTQILGKIGEDLFPKTYLDRFKKLHYLHAVNLILESKEKLLDKTYWLSVCAESLPFMVVVQHTNFVDKKHYGNNNLLYIAKYVDSDDPLIKMSEKEIYDYWTPYLKKINPTFNVPRSTFHVFKAPLAQPIFDKDFLQNKPDFETPVKNFFVANLDMTYPYDRGTNYAVKLGKEVSEKI